VAHLWVYGVRYEFMAGGGVRVGIILIRGRVLVILALQIIKKINKLESDN
jgi:hypothetical protein